MTQKETPLEQPFVRWAGWYDELYAVRGRDPASEVAHLQHDFEWMMQQSGLKRLRLLDVGCGTGVHWASLNEFGDVTGIDRCREMLDVARSRYPQGDWRLCELHDIDADERFHAVLMLFGVAAYAPTNAEAAALLQRAGSRLLPEGSLMVSIEFTSESLRPPEDRVVRTERGNHVLIRESSAAVRQAPDGSEHLVTTFTFRNGAGQPLWREEHQHLIAPYETWKGWLYAAAGRQGLSWQLHIRQSRIEGNRAEGG